MKLFFKEHILLIFVQLLQFIIILSILWLDGHQQFSTALYAFFLGCFFLSCYLFTTITVEKSFTIGSA